MAHSEIVTRDGICYNRVALSEKGVLIAGIVVAGELSRAMGQATAQVRDYMTADPQTLGAEHSLLDAVLIMRRAGLRHIPIMEDGRLIGVLSERDMARAAPSLLLPLLPDDYNRVFEDTQVAKVMTKNPVSTTPDAPLAEAVDLLRSNRLGCLPVVEQGKLVGIITKGDMLRALFDLINLAPSPTSPSREPDQESETTE